MNMKDILNVINLHKYRFRNYKTINMLVNQWHILLEMYTANVHRCMFGFD